MSAVERIEARKGSYHEALKNRRYPPINCGHCGTEFPPRSSTQMYHLACKLEVRAERKRERYHSDPNFRRKILRWNEESEARHLRGETRPRNPVSIERWRQSKLRNEVKRAAILLSGKRIRGLIPLFQEGENIVYISTHGHLSSRSNGTEHQLDARSVLETYGYTKVRTSLNRKLHSFGLKK